MWFTYTLELHMHVCDVPFKETPEIVANVWEHGIKCCTEYFSGTS